MNLQELVKVSGNAPLLLQEPQAFWVIKSGALAVFAVTLRQGQPQGNRRYLFRVQAGEAVFGMAIDGQKHGLLAVALEETTLLKRAIADLSVLHESAGVALVDNWIHKLGLVLVSTPPPTAPVHVSGNQSFSFPHGQIVQAHPGSVCWVQINCGTGRWMGSELLHADASPLSGGIWLEADGTLDLSIIPTQVAIQNLKTLESGLSFLHQQFLDTIAERITQQQQVEWQRLQVREQRDRQMSTNSLEELASVLRPTQAIAPAGGTLLLSAASAVGKAMSVEITDPGTEEDHRVHPVEAIARASRLRWRRILLSGSWWQDSSGPFLAYTSQERRPVALLPMADSKYQLFDPETRAYTPVNATVAATLEADAFVFYRPMPARALKPLDLLQFALQGQVRDLLWIVLTALTASLLNLLPAMMMGILIGQIIPDANRALLLQMGGGLIGAAFGVGIFQLAQQLVTLRVETLAETSTQAAVWDRVLELPVPFFRQYSTGDLNSRIQGISEIRRKLSGSTLQTIFTGLFSVFNLGLMLYYSLQLTWVALGFTAFTVVITGIHGWLKLRQIRSLQRIQGEIFGLVVQLINGIAKLQVAGAEGRAFHYWGQQFSQQQRLNLKLQAIADSLSVFNQVLPIVNSGFLFGIAGFALQGGQITAGSFIAFNTAAATFSQSVTQLSNAAVDVLDIGSLWQRAKPVLVNQLETDPSRGDPGRLSGRLALDRITFRYAPELPPTLKNLSIRAEPGEFIALVGPSGSGKSTIIRLLLGFEAPESGAIYYDGQDLLKLELTAVRRQLGVVLQSNTPSAVSIFENISGGALIGQNDAWSAARMAGFAEDIAAMPMGMHTVVSEGGSNLSGGQRQRLMIARALALKPRILLFDEATSALDNQTQAIVSSSLEQLQVTRVVIAHRLSTVCNADRIYVIEGGQVVQQGSFEDLSKQEGLFAKLIARQIAG